MSTLAFPFFIGSFFILAGNKDSNNSSEGFKFGKIGPGSAELATLERLKNSPQTFSGRNVVSTLVL